jgi:putative DNA primase/helicase
MNFQDFAKGYGLMIGSVIPDRWVATPTEDHPHKRNGRYKFLGDVGWVQNWATMDSPVIWKAEAGSHTFKMTVSHQARNKAAMDDRLMAAKKAATKAGWIMHQSDLSTHPYLIKKGFDEESGNVWLDDGKQILVVPMRKDGSLVGCQLIDEQGAKKFLYGQVSKGASFVIDAKGVCIFCEGYATGLSIRAAMKAMKIRYTIYICFSASNLKVMASGKTGIIVADCDPNGVGEVAAKETGKPYWISDAVGEDFNDYHIRTGLFHASQSLKRVIFSN